MVDYFRFFLGTKVIFICINVIQTRIRFRIRIHIRIPTILPSPTMLVKLLKSKLTIARILTLPHSSQLYQALA